MTLNQALKGKVLITGRLVFAGGIAKFRWIPLRVKWGSSISVYWFGTEIFGSDDNKENSWT